MQPARANNLNLNFGEEEDVILTLAVLERGTDFPQKGNVTLNEGDYSNPTRYRSGNMPIGTVLTVVGTVMTSNSLMFHNFF